MPQRSQISRLEGYDLIASAVLKTYRVPDGLGRMRAVPVRLQKAILTVLWRYDGVEIAQATLRIMVGASVACLYYGLAALELQGLISRRPRRGARYRTGSYVVHIEKLRERQFKGPLTLVAAMRRQEGRRAASPINHPHRRQQGDVDGGLA